MTTKTFDEMPSPNEGIDLQDISAESVKEAWKDYDARPEFKKFNKHDMIESLQQPTMQSSKDE